MNLEKTYTLFICCLLVFACKKDNKNLSITNEAPVIQEKIKDTIVMDSFVFNTTDFNKIIKSIPLKNKPVIDTTSYNSTNPTKFLTKHAIETLQLTKIYPNFYKVDYNYKAKTSYKIKTQDALITIALTIHKGDNELESILINYSLDGNYIDHLVVAYDDLVEGYVRTTSKIEGDIIYKTNKTFFETEDEETWFWQINAEGTFTQLDFEDMLLHKLNIHPENVYRDFFTLKHISETKTLVVIPKIAKKEHEEYTLDAYVLLANAITGAIEASYVEKALWSADAIKISSIEATYNPYKIYENSETVGLKVFYFNGNPVNPYNSVKLTLLEQKETKLNPVLIDFELYYKGGEIDNGDGVLTETEKKITTKERESSTYYSIEVVSKTQDIRLENNHEIISGTTEITEQLTYNSTTKLYNIINY